mgnify:CR=1 FL=1
MTAADVYDAIVIGAGPNGLVCAAYLARAGKRVLLLERRFETGGGLNTDEYFGYRLNLHAIYHMMGELMPAHRDLGLEALGVRYLHPPVAAAFPFRDGSSLLLSRDPAETANSIAGFSPADAAAYTKMWDEFTPILEQYLIPMTYRLPEPALDQMVEFGDTPAGRRLAAISELTFVEMLDEYGFEDPRVRMALLSLPAMWGLHLEDPLGYLYPLYLCRMRAVVSTLDPEQTFLRLLDEKSLPGDLGPAVRGWEWEERTMFGLHLGLRGGVGWKGRDPRIADSMIVFCGLETEDELHEHLRRLDAGEERDCAWLHVTIPTRFDATMAPAGQHLLRAEAVVRYDAPWKEQGAAFGDSCIRLLQEYADLGEIVFRRETTPLDIEAKLTTMKRGSIKHGAYTPLQMGYLRPNDLCSRNETPIRGLFVGGASTYPGGMILGAPGFLAAGVVGEFLAATPD